MPQELFDADTTFFRGCKSDSDPGQLPLGYYWNAINMVNVGGVLSCRPGYKCIAQLPAGHLQGVTLFRPQVGVEQLVICVDGILYATPYPFNTFVQLPNIRLSPTAKQVFWANTTQSARRISSDLTSPVELISPRSVLIVQDGGLSASAWYDGSNSGQLRDDPFGTPSGGPGAWVGDRLWVARGGYLYASDIGNPLSFRELIYLGGIGSLVFKSEITALAVTPGLEAPQLLVFTLDSCSAVQAHIRARDAWTETPGFLREILAIGAVGQRSVVQHFGQLVWMSPVGVVMLDAALQTQVRGRIALRDNEMTVSKSVLSDDLSLVAGVGHGQFVVFSVPAEDSYNKHSWVLNDASLETLQDDSGPSWCGYWLGTRPVEWVSGSIAGTERCYHVSHDEDEVNRLWEAFLPDRRDNECPVTWAVETRGYFGATSQVKKLPGGDCRLAYADVALTAVEEDVDLGVFFAGGMRGAYKPILSRKIKVARGNIHSGTEITAQTELFALKPQSRRLRTEGARGLTVDADTGSCPVERNKFEDIDESFQLMIVGHGPATIRWIRVFASLEAEDVSGDNAACQDETAENAIRFDGAGASGDTALADVAAKPAARYTSNQTELLTSGTFSAVGVGHASSIISQRAADRVAGIVATKQAEALLVGMLPPTLSAGLGL